MTSYMIDPNTPVIHNKKLIFDKQLFQIVGKWVIFMSTNKKELLFSASDVNFSHACCLFI